MFSTIDEVIADVRDGKFVVLVDDEDRENEGDLVLAARHATPEKINFMTRAAGGYLCLSLTEADCERLALTPQAADNTSVRGTPFTVSIDGHPKHGVGTGISAPDRAKTIALAIDPSTGPDDFVRPGHINPLRSRDGGVLVRVGQTEGGVDLARLAGLAPAALIIEIVRDDGEMARRPDLERLCAEHGWKMCSVEQLVAYRLRRERMVHRLEPAAGRPVQTEFGAFTLFAFASRVDPLPHLAFTLGGVGALDEAGATVRFDEPTLVRMHRRDLLGDIFCRTRDGAPPTYRALHAALRALQHEGRGALVYLRPEGRGDAFEQRLTTMNRGIGAVRDAPDLTAPDGVAEQAVPMAQRDIGVGSQILRELGLSRLRVLTNKKKDLPGLEAFGLEIVEHVALQ